jgi:hypothetical protein
MKLEAVITCSRYQDFLAVTLPHTLPHVDHLVVVTSDRSHDDATAHLCHRHSVRCIRTGIFHRRGASFAKGAAINRGLDQLLQGDWVLHLDADIILPPTTRRMLEMVDLDPSCIYGIDRVACPDYATWERFRTTNHHHFMWDCNIVPPPGMPLMSRYVHNHEGYCPIGFFQLWNARREARHVRYPDRGNEAVHTDVQHALQWDGHHRRLIPEIIGIHLNSCRAPVGANWRGRQTPEFKPGLPPDVSTLKGYYDPGVQQVNPNAQAY